MVRIVAGWLLALAGFGIIGWEVFRQLDAIRSHAYIPGPGALLAVLAVMLAQWLAGGATWLLLRRSATALSWWAVLRVHLLAQAAKYLPLGGLLNLGAQSAGLTALPGVRLAPAGVALLYAQLALCAAAATWYGLARLVSDGPATPAAWSVLTLPLLLVLLIWGRPSAVLRPWWPALAEKLAAHTLRTGDALALGVLMALAAGCLGYSLAGVAGDALPLTSAAALQLCGALSLAWLLGYLSVIFPAGLGVRDGLLVILLAGLTPAPWHVVLPVASRLAWVLADLGNFLLVVLVSGRPARRAD